MKVTMNSKSLKMKIRITDIIDKIPDSIKIFLLNTLSFISLILLIKYFFVSLAGLYEPISEQIQIVLTEQTAENNFAVQAVILLKIISAVILAGFILIVYSTFSTTLSMFFYGFCSRKYKKITYPFKYRLTKGLKWNLYRLFLVFTPSFIVIRGISLLILFAILCFNLILFASGISITFTTFVSSFIFFGMVFIFIFSLFAGLWQLIFTGFGTETAVSEPKLDNKTIERRSKNLVSFNYFNTLLFIAYFIFIYNIFAQIKFALITSLFTNPANGLILTGFIVFNLLYFIAFKYLKSASYINSLTERHENILKSNIRTAKGSRIYLD